MITSSKKTVIKILSYLFLLFITGTLSYSQEKTAIPDVEKIYLHTDRSTYTIGESLWYKAYLVYAYNNLLFNNSNVLYVELISPDSKIIARNKTRLEEGLGHGDFKLTDSIGVKSGTYEIRAYTNWNRNFDKDFVFKKEIKILNVFEGNKNIESSENFITEENQTTQEKKHTFKVDFFPEGGSLLENVSSIVAFKAIDNKERPIDVKGKIFDSDGNLVTLFLSDHDGMGKYQIKPISGKEYYAKITNSTGEEIKVELPKANKKGYLLSSKNFKGKNIITLKTNNQTLAENPNAPLTLVCNTRGITYFTGTQSLTKAMLSFELPLVDFPEGINQITLYDSNLKPQSERLIYIEKKDDIQVSVSTDKKLYKPKEEVILEVSSKSKEGNPIPASYSLSSIDTNGTQGIKDYGTNISSYFLMESDIRGKVNNPGYYFDSSNPNRLYHLDLLLLTQGWRDFLWKKLPQIKDSITNKAEKGITLSGHVKQLFGKKPKENRNVSLTVLNKGKTNILFDTTDSLGKFKFENMVFMGEAIIMLNTKNEKGKSQGMLVLDSISQPAMITDFKSDGINYTPSIKSIKEEVYKKYVMYGISPENVLDEVEIIVKNKKEPTSLYGPADNTYVVDEKTQRFSDIYQLIQFSIPGVTALGGKVSFSRYGGQPAYVMVDGVEWAQEDLSGIMIDDVAKIEAFKGPNAAIFGSQGGSGVIVIYTKEGVVNTKSKTVFHSMVKKINGFYDARVFYSPNPEKPDLEADSDATIRNTLYWNPYVFPDETGVSRLSYYNSEVETNVKVTLEGITATGIPIVVKTFYTVEE